MTSVLIVEDSRTQAEELTLILESRGFDVSVERDGLSGLQRCKQQAFDVVLSDVVMPGIDGYELCRRVKTDPDAHDPPFVLLTSLTEPLDIIRGLECGADNFITKPYEADYLVARMRQLLENRRVRGSKKIDVGVDLVLMGKRFTVNSQKEQMVDLLLSTFEEVLRSRQREYEAKVAEESHRRSHKLLQSALDALTTQIAIVDISGEIVAVNAAWRRMSDLCNWKWPAAGVGEDYRVILEHGYGADAEFVQKALAGVQSVRSGVQHFFHLEYQATIRAQPRWFALSATRFEGNGLALLAIENEDITERKQAAREVERSELRLRHQTHILNSILNSMNDGVVVGDRNGELLLANRRAEDLLGVRQAMSNVEWMHTLKSFVSDTKSEPTPETHPLARAIRGEQTRDFDLVSVNAAASQGAMFAVTAAPLGDESGTLHGGVVVVRDVTQQRRLEQHLRQSQKMDAIGQLAGGVAHDFNNLLSVITSYGQLLLKDFADEDSRRDDLMQMLEAAKRAAGLTHQLLAFSRRQMVQPSVLELNSVVSNLEKMLGRIIGEDIDLVTALDPHLGRVRADAGHLEQVLMNLSVNARDAMPNGGKLTIETANVSLSGSFVAENADAPRGRYALLAVTDTGTGMDAETQARIFEPFFTTKEVGKGTGLGLSTVYGIVKQSGGHVWVYSEPGRGTTFKVYLPIVDDPVTESNPQITSARPHASERILIVEDEDAVRTVATRILKEAGYRVHAASNAAEARAICAELGSQIDLLLTDVIMRETNGPELAAELTRTHPRLRVLYMSGYSGAAVFRHGALESGKSFLEKPFAPESLTRKVRDVLDLQEVGVGKS